MTGQPLATWSEVQAYLARTYRDLVPDGDARCELTVVLPPTPTEPGASIRLEARTFDPRWLALTSVIGSLANLSTRDQLIKNVQATIGTLCTRDGALAIRQTLPLGALAPTDLDESVRALVQATLFVRGRLRALEA